jgi:predicted outer membrane repeat protein
MYNDSGSPTVTNCTFYRNTSWTIYAYSCPENTYDTGIPDFDFSFDLMGIFMRDTSGAGIYNFNSSMTLRNCTFEENISFGADSSSAGGGIHNINSDVVLINCIFKTNVATGFDNHYWGGAIDNSDSNLTLEGCSFIENLAYYGGGGALTLGSATSVTLTNCTFIGNAAEDGGAICGLGQATLTNCSFHENVATFDGGAIYSGSGKPTLVNCTFSNNSADKGGGMYNQHGSPTLTNCTFTENPATQDGGGIYNIDSSPTLTNCIFGGNSANFGGAMCNSQSNPTVTGCIFSENKAGTGGGMVNIYSSPTVIKCTFRGNSAQGSAVSGGVGGAMNNFHSNITITGCTFNGNFARDGSGGMKNYTSNPIISNCTFIGNYGGGMENENSSPILTNCAFTGNSAIWSGAGIYNYNNSKPTLTNCILWNDSNEIWNGDDSTITITYSDVQGGWPGEGNINSNPLFVDSGYWDANGTPDDSSDDVWLDGDYRLLPGSPCIDAGDPNYIAGPNETDLDGRPRIIGGRIDMGAYETPIFAEARILPRTINLASKGKWITCYIWLPDDYDVADIEPGSVMLERQIKAEQFSGDEQRQVATATFDREKVQGILNIGDIELKISCQLTDGTYFEATDIIQVTDKGGGKSSM